MSEFKRILITGATGFLGSHIVPILKSSLDAEIIPVNRTDYDLLHPDEAEKMLKETSPDAVLHLAAKSGGIITNAKHPADFFYENITINTQVFHSCFKAGVSKFVTFMGGCSYPSDATSPISEDQMWNGFPQPESAPYSVAKKMMLIQSDAYRKQHGFNSVVLIPGNVYGEYDNFNEEQSHVIPALVRRFLETKEKNSPDITCYGSGRPTRDFVYAGDVAKLIPWFFSNYESSEPVNISSGTRTSIKELAETIKDLTCYEGDIIWDTSKPDGQIDKIFGVERLHSLGLSCDTSLKDGLSKTIKWFEENRDKDTVRT